MAHAAAVQRPSRASGMARLPKTTPSAKNDSASSRIPVTARRQRTEANPT